MKKTMNIGKNVAFFYIIGLFGMLSILVLIGISREVQTQKIKEEAYQDISASWTLEKEGTQSVDIKKLGEYMDAESGVLSIYYQLPQMDADINLVYRSKDVYTKVLVDEDVIYETQVYESRLYNKSPGNLWNVLTINAKHSQKCLEMQIFMVYDTDAITVDSLFLGDKAEIILGIFKDKIFGIVISLLLVLLGLVLSVSDFLPTYGRAKQHHGLAWIGLYAFLTGLWCLIETNVLQFCVEDMRILQLMDNMLMMISNMPLLLYLNSEYKIFQYRIMRIIGYIYIGFMYLCIAVQYSGIKDLHDMIVGTMVIMFATILILLIWIVRMLVRLKKEKKPLLNCALQFSGVCALWFFAIFESIRSSNVDQMDRAGLIRVGMLILSLCFAISSQIETYKIVEQGLKYNLISKLAYSDGLTGLGNRTAYLEQLDEYSNMDYYDEQFGIVYLDVNNLKMVNDNLGHEFGDEFCVLMTGINLKEKYAKALESFNQLIDEAIASTDSQMYQNKMELKRVKNAKF